MVLQSTGAISFANIQVEFGGANPISLNEYYLNGAYTTGTGAAGIPTSGAISLNNFYGKSKVIVPAGPAIPVTTGLYARYTGDGPFTKTGNNITTWYDIGGANRHITTYRGTPTQVSVAQGLYGTTGTSSFNVVNGTTVDGFQLPFALPQNNNLAVSSYTIVYIARYVGDRNNITGNNRIFDSTAAVGNHLWGFHGNVAGRSHNGNLSWRTETFTKQSDPNYWMIGVETELNHRFNGIDWTLSTNSSKSTTTPTFSINYGAYSGDGNSSEVSNWQVAELVFYDRELTLNERISLEQFLALKYGHISFSNVVSTIAAYKLLTNNTGAYSGWYNIWNGGQYSFYNAIWEGPGRGQYVLANNLAYFGILYSNGNQNTVSGYANRNNSRVTYNISTIATTGSIHILCGGGGGGGGGGIKGGGGGAGGMCYIANSTNLSNLTFTLNIGAVGYKGSYYNSWSPGSGGDTSIGWTINGSANSLLGYGGAEGANSDSHGAGGIYTVSNVNTVGTAGGGNGQGGIGGSSANPGGAIFAITNIPNLWNVAYAFGVRSTNTNNWWDENYTGNGGSSSGNMTGANSYAINATIGGVGWVLIAYGANVTGAVVEYMLAGNVAGNMSTAGGTQLTSISNVDDASVSIGTVGFSFFFFGTDYNNNIFWSTNQVLQFGTNVGTINWKSNTGRGILLGNYDRRTRSAHQFPSYTSNNHSIKKIIIDHWNHYGDSQANDTSIKMEIRLIRGPQNQYVEVRINQWTAGNAGLWTFANLAASFINIFNVSQTGPPTGTGSFVLRSDLNGNNWQLFNNYYINL
jgi:hypothetical protein